MNFLLSLEGGSLNYMNEKLAIAEKFGLVLRAFANYQEKYHDHQWRLTAIVV